MIDFIYWLITISLLGWLAFPICFAFFNKAYDRGYSVVRIIGLLLWGYLYWLGNLSGLLANNRAGAVSAVLLLAVVSFLFVRKQGWAAIRQW
jgi:uncharacterized membrane protein YjjB (DUF3815 family)